MTHALKLEPGWPASLALHALLLLAAIFLMPKPPAMKSPVERLVPIELVVPPKPADAVPPRPAPPAIVHSPRPAIASAAPPPDAMVKAGRFYSADVLADPRSRHVKKALASFAPAERAIQLCNLEAMEQIHRWKAEFRPDLVVPYATADIRIEGRSIDAEGGAFRADRRWYKVRFVCDVADDLATVTAFQFSVGDAIPQARWNDYNLVADDGPEDEE